MTNPRSPRCVLALLLLSSAAPGCNLIDKYCIGDCPAGASDDEAGSTGVNEPDDPATGTEFTTSDSTTMTTTQAPTDEPPGGCEIVDTIFAPATCDDGVFVPGEICFTVGGGTVEFPAGVASFAALQLDAVGDDIVLVHADGSVISVLYGQGPGLSPTEQTWSTGFGPGTLLLTGVGDFDEDGALDVAARLDGATDTVELLRMDGAGGLAGATQVATGAAINGPKVADFDADGHLDLVIADPQTEAVTLWKGDGAGGFTAAPVFTYDGAKHRFILAAFEADGVRDDFVFGYPNGDLALRSGDSIQIFGVGETIYDLAAADFNGDGHEDLAVLVDGPQGTSEVAIVVQIPVNIDGFVSFETTRYPVQCGAGVLALGDVDGDGAVDVVTGSPGSPVSIATILRGDGDGGISGVMTVKIGDPIDDLLIVDLNGDGAVELATLSHAVGSFGVTLNSP